MAVGYHRDTPPAWALTYPGFAMASIRSPVTIWISTVELSVTGIWRVWPTSAGTTAEGGPSRHVTDKYDCKPFLSKIWNYNLTTFAKYRNLTFNSTFWPWMTLKNLEIKFLKSWYQELNFDDNFTNSKKSSKIDLFENFWSWMTLNDLEIFRRTESYILMLNF